MQLGKRLNRSFYQRDVVCVAQDCVGRVLVHDGPWGRMAARIVEVEAYRGPDDRAAHSFGGRRTPRTEVMFGAAGHAYVFLLYGLHWNLNLVTGATGEPQAVLLRAVEPLLGLDEMARARGLPPAHRDLTSGPGRLCQALRVGGDLYGVDLTRGALHLRQGEPPDRLACSARIGVDYAGEWRETPYRFFNPSSPQLSVRGARAPRPQPVVIGQKR